MCGIIGCFGVADAARVIRDGMQNLLHRGEAGCGIVSSDGTNLYPERAPHKALGWASHAITEEVLSRMPGDRALAHLRYPTQGRNDLANLQPHLAQTRLGPICFAANGDIVNCKEIRAILSRCGVSFYSDNDGEVFVKLIAYFIQTGLTVVSAIQQAKHELVGSYSAALMMPDKVFLFRDPMENRPYCWTQTPSGGVYFASEPTALQLMLPSFRPEDHQEISRDAIVELSNVPGLVTLHPDPVPASERKTHCIFELVYFARPDSRVFDVWVEEARQRVAQVILDEVELQGDFISAVPDSANVTALELAQLSGIRFQPVLTRSHFGRTFTNPDPRERKSGVRKKLNPNQRVIKGATIILDDDSIVRGTSMREIIDMLLSNGAKKLVVIVNSPPVRYKCHFGIDFKDNLIAVKHNGDIGCIKQELGLREQDELHFVSLPGLLSCVDDPQNWCTACFDGNYPADVSRLVQVTSS